jgi:hypothetical protein
MTLRFKKRGEKALERALRSDAVHGVSKGKWKGRPHARTITEVDEPSPVSPVIVEPLPAPSACHRRERALVDGGEESDA